MDSGRRSSKEEIHKLLDFAVSNERVYFPKILFMEDTSANQVSDEVERELAPLCESSLQFFQFFYFYFF